ncbi:MAG: glycosyltransferase [Anaerolineales bacterium]|nr:glycosyltransferase [Anaerolineales bacterium]MDW8162774.1 glycosyltransferase [Anaerolineales bacterium]
MRILLITSTYPRFRGDGAGSFIHSISEKLLDRGHELYVIAPDNHQSQSQWQNKVCVDRIRYIWPKKLARLGHGESLRSDTYLKWYSYILVSLFSLFALVRIVTNPVYRRVDVIYAHWLLPGGLIGALISRLLKIPLVIHLHGSDIFVSERYKIFRPLVMYTIHSVSKIIACSKDLADRVKNLGAKDVQVIPYGVDVDLFLPDRNTLKKGASGIAEPKYVTAIGRLVNKKGFNYLIMAAEEIVKVYPQCKIQIVGDGDQRDELVKLSDSLKLRENVVFLGNIPWSKIPDVMNKTDVFVLPSIIDDRGNVDGLPVVLLEAMSSGCAVVASKIGGVPDVIVDRVNGILVEPRNYRQLAEAIISLLLDDEYRNKLGRSAREEVEANYTWDVIVKRIEMVLEESTIVAARSCSG